MTYECECYPYWSERPAREDNQFKLALYAYERDARTSKRNRLILLTCH